MSSFRFPFESTSRLGSLNVPRQLLIFPTSPTYLPTAVLCFGFDLEHTRFCPVAAYAGLSRAHRSAHYAPTPGVAFLNIRHVRPKQTAHFGILEALTQVRCTARTYLLP